MACADLSAVDLGGADLTGVSLAGAKLIGANLVGAVLEQANLSGADLTEADLSAANLSGANLRGAQLHNTNVAGANLHRAAIDQVYAAVLRKFDGTPAWGSGASPSVPARYATNGSRVIHCPHCDGDLFEARDLMLNTRGLTFLDLDWLNQTACALVCVACGHIDWFAKPPMRV